MRLPFLLLFTCSAALALSNAVTIQGAANAQAGRPFTISRFFARGEIAKFARPRINGTPAAVWQCDAKTTWPDGSLQHALISFAADVPHRTAITVDFVNQAERSSAGAPLTQQEMLDFDGGSGPASWDAQLEATAPFVTPGTKATYTVNVRAMLASGKWRYWLKGPAATQVIVEDREFRSASDQTSYDFGWQRLPPTRLAAPIAATDQTSIQVENPSRWRAPFTATIEAEDVYVCAVTDEGFNIGTASACPSKEGRGYHGTTAARHTPDKRIHPNVWEDAPSIQLKSMHPIFVLTFYRGWKGVKVEAILENAWATRLQDQAFGLVLSAGKPLHKVYSRPTVFDWYQAMSRRRKTIWSGHEPEFALVDYNFPYLVYSRAVPNYDVTINLSEMAYSGSYKSELEYYNTRTEKGTREPQFCQSPSPVFVGNSTFCSEWQMRTGDGGGRPDIGLFPLWYIRYLYSMGSTTLSEAQKTDFYKRSLLENAEAGATAPFHIRESLPGRFYDANRKQPAFGLPISLNARPGVRLDQPNSSGQRAEDGVQPVGTVLSDYQTAVSTASGAVIQRWALNETAHQPSFAYVPYLITGDWFFLEEQCFLAAFDVALLHPAASNETSGSVESRLLNTSIVRHGNWGFLGNGLQSRGVAWGLRTLGHAAIAAPDGTAEKAYFMELLNNNVRIREGALGITNGSFPPADPKCANYNAATSQDKWCWGRITIDAGLSNPLHIPFPGNAGLREGLSVSRAMAGDAPWMRNFLYIVLGHLEEAGLPQLAPYRKAAASYLLRELRDSGYNPFLAGEYRSPTLCTNSGGYCQTMKDVLFAFSWSAPLMEETTAQSNTIVIKGNAAGPDVPHLIENFPAAVQIDNEKIRVCNSSITAAATRLQVCGDGRGWAGTTAAPHQAGASVTRLVDSFSAPMLEVDQGYVYFLYAASVYLSRLTVNDSITGQPITGESAIEFMRGQLRNTERLLDDPKWAYVPRHEVADVVVTPGRTDALVKYSAPSPDACRHGIVSGDFQSTDDSGDASQGGNGPRREYSFKRLTPGTTYTYRVTCGPKKGTTRATGSFTTKP